VFDRIVLVPESQYTNVKEKRLVKKNVSEKREMIEKV